MVQEKIRQQKNADRKFKEELKGFSSQLGRDGAYMEVGMKDIVDAFSGPEKPKVMVITKNRFDLPEEENIVALESIVKKMSPELENMSNEQKSFYIFKKIFEQGLKSLSSAKEECAHTPDAMNLDADCGRSNVS